MRNLFSILILAAGLTACGSGDNQNQSQNRYTEDGTVIPAGRYDPSDVGARWRSYCSPLSGRDAIKSELLVYEGSLVALTSEYDDKDCITKASDLVVTMNVHPYKSGASYVFQSGYRSIQSANMTLKNQRMVDQANNAQLCGYSDWVLNQPKDVLGTDCLSTDVSGIQITAVVTGNYMKTNECFLNRRNTPQTCDVYYYYKVQ